MTLKTQSRSLLSSQLVRSRLCRVVFCRFLALLCCGVFLSPHLNPHAFGAEEPSGGSTGTINSPQASASTNNQAGDQAKMVLGLEESLKRDAETLESLRAEYDSPESEYNQAQAALEKD